MFRIRTVILIFIFSYSVTSGKQCNTPDNKTGQCLPISNCPTLIDFVNKVPKPFTPEVKNLLKTYVCTYEDNPTNTRLCCPSEPITTNEKNTEDDSATILNHKNLKLLPEDCGLIDTGDKIRGGTNAHLREFPWMALLSYSTETGPQFKCGGSIINDRYILTAAHCVVDTPNPLVGVRVGEYDLSTDKDCDPNNPKVCLQPHQDLTVEKVISHPSYNTLAFTNDIALIRVSKINLITANVQAVCLPVYEDIIDQEFDNGIVTGWGYTDAEGKTTADVLQKVKLTTQNLSVCISAYSVQPTIKLSNKQICVGGKGVQDSCRGDSGGPFQVGTSLNDEARYVQHGVVSIGHRLCGTEGFPGVYTRVSKYAKWILDNIKA